MIEFTHKARHYCRNPKCRSKLQAPVSNPREGFCAPGCRRSFYLRRCLVCAAVAEGRPDAEPQRQRQGVPNKFSAQLVADFAADWRAHGAAAIKQLREENVAAYVKIATSLVPRELLLQVSRPLVELSDDELQAAALAERDQATMLIEHIRLRRGAELIEQAQREVLGEDEEDNEDA
jgi:hypothetical protein